MSIETGGPAFPVPFSLDPAQGGPVFAELYGNGGMSLRDYFAAKAMQGMMAGNWNTNYDAWAEHAYQLADAMLRARQEPQP